MSNDVKNTLALVAAATVRAKKAANRAANDAIDTAAAHRMAYPKPCTVRARAVDASVRVARSNTCNTLRAVEELDELVTALTAQVARLQGRPA